MEESEAEDVSEKVLRVARDEIARRLADQGYELTENEWVVASMGITAGAWAMSNELADRKEYSQDGEVESS